MSGGLRSISDLPAFRCGTPDERQWLRLAIQASAWVEGTDKGDRELKFREPAAVDRLCDKSFAKGADGTVTAAWALINVGLFDFPSRVFSGLLTKLVCSPFSRYRDEAVAVREAMVGPFGGLLVCLADIDAGKVLAWVVDMAQGNRLAGVDRQPTEVIRGLLFAPRVDWSHRMKFWELAADHEKFPDRVFCDPCDPANGRIFSSYHCRAFGRFLDWAPEAAVQRFVAVMRDGIRLKVVREKDEERHRICCRLVSASPDEIREAQRRVVDNISHAFRRELVASILFPPPSGGRADTTAAD